MLGDGGRDEGAAHAQQRRLIGGGDNHHRTGQAFRAQVALDEFADLALLRPLVGQLGAYATLRLFEEADHSFHVPARTGRKDSDVRAEMVEVLAGWIARLDGFGVGL